MAVAILSPNSINFTSDGSTEVVKLTATSSAALTLTQGINSVEIFGVADPTTANSAANKAYVDNVAVGVYWKEPVRVVATTNGTITTAYANGQVVDGVTLATNDRIVLVGQTSAVENGIYVVQPFGAPQRSLDLPAGSHASGVAVFIKEGTVNANSARICTTDAPSDIVGTNPLTFVQFTGLGQIDAGDGLDKVGNTLDVDSTVLRTTGAQTIAGVKTFSDAIALSGTVADTGYIQFSNTVAPTTTTNKLYVVGGTLTYNGAPVGGIQSGVVNRIPYYNGAFTIDDSNIIISNDVATLDALTLSKINVSNGLTSTAGEVLISGGNIQLNDNIKLTAGTADNLELYYDGTSTIKAVTNNLLLKTSGATASQLFELGSTDVNTKFSFTNSSPSAMLEMFGDKTANSSLSLTCTSGFVRLNDNIPLRIGTDDDLVLSHTGTNGTITNNTGSLTISNSSVGDINLSLTGTSNTTNINFNGGAGNIMSLNADTSATSNALMEWNAGYLLFKPNIPLYFNATSTSLRHTGTGGNFTITNGIGDLNLVNNTGANTKINLTLATSTTLSAFRVQNSGTSDLFTVDGTGVGTFTNTNQSTTSTNGSVVLSGGIGIAKDIRCAGNSYAISHNSTSDKRLKRDITDVDQSDLDKLDLIESKAYYWKEGSTAKQWGVVAQQVEEHLPDLVETDGDSFKSINMMSLVGLLLAKVHDLQKQLNKIQN